jgi:hypothetical protein
VENGTVQYSTVSALRTCPLISCSRGIDDSGRGPERAVQYSSVLGSRLTLDLDSSNTTGLFSDSNLSIAVASVKSFLSHRYAYQESQDSMLSYLEIITAMETAHDTTQLWGRVDA